MSILVAVPFNRPERLDHVLEMWFSQAVLCPLVLVCNEFGDWTKDAIEAGATVITGQASIGGARNAAVEYAKKTGFDWIAMLDDDNYYSPKYIETIRNNISDDVDVLSQGIAFVRFDNGDLHLFHSELHFAPGHCTAFRVSKSALFPQVNLAEDVVWSRRMKTAGAKFKHLPPFYSIYNRTGSGHAYDANQHEFMKCFGASQLIGKVPDSFVDKPSDCFVEAKDEEVLEALRIRLDTAIATGMFI